MPAPDAPDARGALTGGRRASQHAPVRRVFVRHTGIAAPFLRRDLEVEFIAPLGPDLRDLHALHLRPGEHAVATHTHDGSSTVPHAFDGFRYRPDGSENPDFILNQKPYREASILLAGENFGLGSLQGFAVVRLMSCGMRVVVAPSFGPVFYDDCFDYGLLPVTLGREIVERIAGHVVSSPVVETTVDLERQVIERPGMETVPFTIDSRRRSRLLLGTDGLDESLRHEEDARALRDADRERRPWIYGNNPG